MNTGQYISGAGHLGLIAYALLGGLFLTPEESAPVSVQEVALISEAEFAAMSNNTAPAVDIEAPTPRAPEVDQAPNLAPVEEATPDVAPSTVPADAAPEPAPQVEQSLPEPPQADVADQPPARQPEPELSLEDPGANLPDPASRPVPRPVPRIADQAVTTPDPTPEIADTVTPQVSPDAQSDQVAEETQEESAPQETTTEIVTEAEKPAGMSSSPRPRARPASITARAEAEQETPVSQPTPDPAPAQSDPVADAAAAAAAAAAQLAAEAAETPAAPARPAGPPLTGGERDALRVAVSQCWNVGAMSSDALRTTITVGVAMNEDGTPQSGSIRLLSHSGGTDAGAQAAFDVARRAILRCGARGFNLPVEKFAHWRNIEMTFDPEQMRFK